MAIILTSQNVDHVEMYFGLAVFLRLAISTQTSPLIKTVRGQFIEETVYFSKFIGETVHFSRICILFEVYYGDCALFKMGNLHISRPDAFSSVLGFHHLNGNSRLRSKEVVECQLCFHPSVLLTNPCNLDKTQQGH